ncbi:mandelate racemase/muconate lactonizing enzyme family protein [Cupriavidus consociatus]|uniref:mandelate racemase/muconate lactonizing enzyme family protein n=1 Tax=Cupriavidus consociatus TaxID=2821357 RepID=UPI001AE22632|nr:MULTISPECIES: mandelate racemase/muconate lactonizing enzyme family protein [unclassified Cupriavidus]MBP0623357.1 mandelate racemase/muconate lactonizing enzyme family protein [Cupriavidus sp. LEh25]MDK2660054.1 mandelate racemase/muconate lactonizing enzyme family protein [Cupriavidus sp. LEh21]
MKITKVETLEIELDGVKATTTWRPVFARVYTDEGITGMGEVGMTFGAGAVAAGPMIRDLAKRFVLGKDPHDTETIWETMLRRSFWAQGGGPVVFGAMSAIDAALWDIKGKVAGLPVHRLLGAETPAEPLRCYASQLHFGWEEEHRTLDDPAAYLEAAQMARSQGYDCVKVCPICIPPKGQKTRKRGGFGPAERKLARARMEAVREGIGPDADIIIELNGITSAVGAVQLSELLTDLDILYVEEATHYNSPDAHVRVSQRAPIKMATGERLYTRWGFLPYLQAGSIDMIQPDMGLVGGISEGMKIAHLAHAFDVGVQAHICGSPLATAIALQFEAAIPNFEIHEHHSFCLKSFNKELFEEDLQPVDGRITVPTAPGFGMTLSKDAEKRMEKAEVVLK